MFVGAKASEIIEGLRYDILFKVTKAKNPQPFPGIVLALGNKAICDEQFKLRQETPKNAASSANNQLYSQENAESLKRENSMLKRRIQELEEVKNRVTGIAENYKKEVDQEKAEKAKMKESFGKLLLIVGNSFFKF